MPTPTDELADERRRRPDGRRKDGWPRYSTWSTQRLQSNQSTNPCGPAVPPGPPAGKQMRKVNERRLSFRKSSVQICTKDVVLEYCTEEDRAIIKMSESKMIIGTRVPQTTELLATTGTLSVHRSNMYMYHEHATTSTCRSRSKKKNERTKLARTTPLARWRPTDVNTPLPNRSQTPT